MKLPALILYLVRGFGVRGGLCRPAARLISLTAEQIEAIKTRRQLILDKIALVTLAEREISKLRACDPSSTTLKLAQLERLLTDLKSELSYVCAGSKKLIQEALAPLRAELLATQQRKACKELNRFCFTKSWSDSGEALAALDALLAGKNPYRNLRVPRQNIFSD